MIILNYPDKNKNSRPERNRNNNAMKKAEEAVRAFRTAGMPGENDHIQSDVLGSYTGMSYDGGVPDQDADDL
jgi:hypothetical protein